MTGVESLTEAIMALHRRLDHLTTGQRELADREAGWLEGASTLAQRVEALEANRVWDRSHFTGNLQGFVFQVCHRLEDLETRLGDLEQG